MNVQEPQSPSSLVTATLESVEYPMAWFVGGFYNETGDQTARFVAEGIWENGNDNRYLELVRSMRPGDRIAIKSCYVRKHGLPFDNRGLPVSAMAIKAIGTVLENLNDGRRVRVEWTPVTPAREWYFYTHRATVWRVQASYWMPDALIKFAFDGGAQDTAQFCNASYWRERFGTQAPGAERFGWTKFYEAVADKLLVYRDNRGPLLEAIQSMIQRVEGLGHLLQDEYSDGTTGFLRDICPFTVMGLFNQGITDPKQCSIMQELAQFLGVEEAVPESVEGIPVLNNLKPSYFSPESSLNPDHIDSLWELFAAALAFADSGDEEGRARFSQAFDQANGRTLVAWDLTVGLHWVRPWSFLSLDSGSRLYINKKLGMPIEWHGPKGTCNATDYLAVMDALIPRFQEPSYPANSFPELSLLAWRYKDPTDESEDDDPDLEPKAEAVVPYSIDDVLREGCFLTRKELEQLLVRLRSKKNLILQGPPGTGKTWLARRLAFALIGQKDESKVRAVQFHPNLSYEDFVRGWRPTGDGRLSLADGIFMEVIKAAAKDPVSRFVVVIEEINRGNPAQIFGELLTLLEAGKRTPSEALELCYSDADGVRRPVHIPENLYVIGTMNIADRSLALVDLALRRRFAFADLEPRLGPAWRDWVNQHCGLDADLAKDIEQRLEACNATIAGDARLGKQFRVGHSYVTPPHLLEPGETRGWFRQVVETEIGPLLEEYWFDSPAEAKKARELLLKDWE